MRRREKTPDMHIVQASHCESQRVHSARRCTSAGCCIILALCACTWVHVQKRKSASQFIVRSARSCRACASPNLATFGGKLPALLDITCLKLFILKQFFTCFRSEPARRLSCQTPNTSMAVPSRSADAATIFGFVCSGRGSRLIIALPVALRCKRGILKTIMTH